MFNKGDLHHAYVIEGEKEGILSSIQSFLLDDLAFSIQGNPDYTYIELPSFGVDDARSLSDRQLRTPAQGDKKIFVIVFGQMTREAQNALLKVFEEPTLGTHFFLITPSISTLLPTLKSRMRIIERRESGEASSVSKEAKTFFAGSLKDRLSIIKRIADEEFPKQHALVLIAELEQLLQPKLLKGDTLYREAGEAILKAHSYLEDTSPSVKMLLELVALSLPFVK